MAQLADEAVVIDHGRLVVHAPVGELTMGTFELTESTVESAIRIGGKA